MNETWQMLADAGLAWGVTASLAPGEVLTLTVGGPYYRPDASVFSGLIPAGTPVYAQVDSAHAGVAVRGMERYEMERYHQRGRPAAPSAALSLEW